nr:hypothetical protein [Tanacetum cinerariifolium]
MSSHSSLVKDLAASCTLAILCLSSLSISACNLIGKNGHDMEVDTVKPVYTASASVTTASIIASTGSPTRVSTADDNTMAVILVYIRKSATKDK